MTPALSCGRGRSKRGQEDCLLESLVGPRSSLALAALREPVRAFAQLYSFMRESTSLVRIRQSGSNGAVLRSGTKPADQGASRWRCDQHDRCGGETVASEIGRAPCRERGCQYV